MFLQIEELRIYCGVSVVNEAATTLGQCGDKIKKLALKFKNAA